LGDVQQWSPEYRVFQHLVKIPHGHGEVFAKELRQVQQEQWRTRSLQRSEQFFQVISLYMAAVAGKEREGMPLIGITKDRQVLRGIHRELDKVRSLLCFCCGQIHAHVPLWERMLPAGAKELGQKGRGIRMYTVTESLQRFYHRDQQSFHLHLGLELYKARFCAEDLPGGNPFNDDATVAEASRDFVKDLQLPGVEHLLRLLCCPEDVQRCPRCSVRDGPLCAQCSVPLCQECADCIVSQATEEIPMALCNDNFWGYVTELIYNGFPTFFKGTGKALML
jgi:hypothetical protein